MYAEAPCREVPNLFVQPRSSKDIAAAKAMCMNCTVRFACLQEAERAGDTCVVRGGKYFRTKQHTSVRKEVLTTSRNVVGRSASGYKGVRLTRGGDNWGAYIKKNGKVIPLGVYNTPEDAAKAYDVAARELHGESSWFNFPELRGLTGPSEGSRVYLRHGKQGA